MPNAELHPNDLRKDGSAWTADELAARQILATLSLAVEAMMCVDWPTTDNMQALLIAAMKAKQMADFALACEEDCIGAEIPDHEKFLSKCAKCAIPMYGIAQDDFCAWLQSITLGKLSQGQDIQCEVKV